jgi:hypothetical protein
MKKITLLIALMITSLGFSQTLPLDFSDPLDALFGDNCATSVVDDAGNAVAQIVGSGQLYDNGQKDLAAKLNLSDDANNTITFRIKPVNGTGSGSHLLKFEGSSVGPANTELPFTTTGTSWQTITLNFPAGLGSYVKLVLFTDFNNASVDTYLVDDFAGGTNDTPIVPITDPTTVAPTPPARNAGDVISIFSGAYTNLAGTDISKAWGQSTNVSDITVSGDVIKKMTSFNYQGVVPTSTINASGGYKLHIDIYKTDMVSMEIFLINPGPVEKSFVVTPTLVGWNSFDIDLNATNFPGINFADVFQIKLVSNPFSGSTTYFDNFYFWKGTALGVAKFETSSVKMYPNPVRNTLTIEANSAIQKISVYNILGQEVMSKSPKSSSATLQTSALEKGTYIVKTDIDGNISTNKLIKE